MHGKIIHYATVNRFVSNLEKHELMMREYTYQKLQELAEQGLISESELEFSRSIKINIVVDLDRAFTYSYKHDEYGHRRIIEELRSIYIGRK